MVPEPGPGSPRPDSPHPAQLAVGVVGAGRAGTALGQHAATLCNGQPGVLHGCLTYVLQDEDGQTADV